MLALSQPRQPATAYSKVALSVKKTPSGYVEVNVGKELKFNLIYNNISDVLKIKPRSKSCSHLMQDKGGVVQT